jgi:hypothetical protein
MDPLTEPLSLEKSSPKNVESFVNKKRRIRLTPKLETLTLHGSTRWLRREIDSSPRT